MNVPLTKQINNLNNNNKNDEPQITNLLNINTIKIKEINSKSVELILTENSEEAFELLKKLETYLESNIFEPNFIPDKKILIIILHNLACACQKIHDYENCIIYLETVIYHFDKEIEKKYNIKITIDYFFDNLNNISESYKNNKLGDLILELRFSAKFHLQMSAALSEINRHVDSLNHAKLGLLMCEDNLIKTNLLFFKMKQNDFKDSVIELSVNNNKKNNLIEKITQNSKIIFDICNKIRNIHNKKNFNKAAMKNFLFTLNEGTKNNNFSSYLNYRKSEISKYQKNNVLFNNIKKYFEIQNNDINNDNDWINLINISNILYLSPLNYEDLDLESDPKYELLRDSILEKIIMLTIALLCVSTELKILSNNKNDTKLNGEFFHYHCINFAYLFLPTKCPIIRSYINLYYNSYGQNIDVIPEGEIMDIKISLLQNVNLDIKNPLFFIRNEHINYSINNKNETDYETMLKAQFTKKKKKSEDKICPNSDNNYLSMSSSQNDLNKYSEIITNNKVFDLAKKTKIKDNIGPKFKLDFHNINQITNLFNKNIKNFSNKSNSNPKRTNEKEKNYKNNTNSNKSDINKWKKINLMKNKNHQESLNGYITKINNIALINNGGQSERLIYNKPFMQGVKIFENKNQQSIKQKTNSNSQKKTKHSLTDRKLTTDRLKSARLPSREDDKNLIHKYNSFNAKKQKKIIGKENNNKKYNTNNEKKEINKKLRCNSNKCKNDKDNIRPLLDRIFNNLQFYNKSKDSFVDSGKFLLSLKTSTGLYHNKYKNKDMNNRKKRAKSKD